MDELAMTKPRIRHFVFMGDSLSDRGTFDRRRLFGIFPMADLTNLRQKSPLGRFTNGLVWTDYLARKIISKHFPESGPQAVTLNDDLYIHYQGLDFVRAYDEGGLTSSDYSWIPSNSISRFFARLFVATLGLKRKLLLAYDKSHELTSTHKRETLLVEWSGANDLMTVNAHPSKLEVEAAVRARINNIKSLHKEGYRHFMLVNMPDLALTPRYQHKSKVERQRAHDCSKLFNHRLKEEILTLRASDKHVGCSFEIFDAANVFREAFYNPELYGFNPNRKTEPYITSKAFKISLNHIEDSGEHMFWDEVHPTTRMHEAMAQKVFERLSDEYQFEPPVQEALDRDHQQKSASHLVECFKVYYLRRLSQDKSGWLGCFRRSRLMIDGNFELTDIVKHALFNGGERTREIITQLGWIDKQGSQLANIDALTQAFKTVKCEQDTLRAGKSLEVMTV